MNEFPNEFQQHNIINVQYNMKKWIFIFRFATFNRVYNIYIYIFTQLIFSKIAFM